MKTLLSLGGGALTVTEDAGVITASFSDKAAVGGGQAAGLLKIQGAASVVLDAASGLQLAEALLNAHLPASVQALATVVEGVANEAVKAVE